MRNTKCLVINFFSLLFIVLAASCQTNSVNVNSEISGIYAPLIIAYDQKHQTVSGYYENCTGIDENTGCPQFSCIFYFTGKLEDNKAKIKSWYPQDVNPEVIEGILEITENKEIKLKLNSEHGGCWNVEKLADKLVTFTKDSSTTWIAIRIAKNKRTYLYSSPDENTKLKSYVITGDLLKVINDEKDWVNIEYSSTKKVIRGWVKKSDLYSMTP